MITINYSIKNEQFEAHYKDSNGFLVKFGPYPTKEAMEISINEYMMKCKISMYCSVPKFVIKKEHQVIH